MDATQQNARSKASSLAPLPNLRHLAHFLLVATLAVGFSSRAQEIDRVTLAWNGNSETNLSTYILKYGGASGSYTGQVVVATNYTAATVPGLTPHRTYYFVVTARNTHEVESDPSNEVTYYVPRQAPNTVPIANAATVTTSEDIPRAITLAASDGDNDPLSYSIQTPPANGVLSGTPPNLTYTPRANFFGTDSFRFKAGDGLADSAIATVAITVLAVNDTPTLNSLGRLTLASNAGPQTVFLTGISSGASSENQPLSVRATSSNPSLVPHPTVNYVSPSATGSLSFTPTAGANGAATITVTVDDGQPQNNSVSRAFSVVVGTPPLVTLFLEAESGTLSAPMQSGGAQPGASNGRYIFSPVANSGRVSFNLNITVPGDYMVWCRHRSADGNTDSFFVSVDGETSDVYDTAPGGWSPDWQWTQLNGRFSGIPRLLALTQGSHTLTFDAREANTSLDGLYVTSDTSFNPAPPPNQPPTLDPISNLTLASNSGPYTVRLTGITPGAYWEDQALQLRAVSSNPTLIPNPTIQFDPLLDSGSLMLRPANNASGLATITVSVDDGAARSNTVSRSFRVKVGTPVFATLFVEAESGYVAPPMGLVANDQASGSTYISSTSPSNGIAHYTLSIPQSDTYTVWCRVVSRDGGADSFFVAVDGAGEDVFDTGLDGYSGSWQWTLLNGRGLGTVRRVNLSRGTHTLSFRGREQATALDAIYVTNDPDFAPVTLQVSRAFTPVRGMAVSFQSPAGYRFGLQATEDLKTWTTLWQSSVATANQRFSFLDTNLPASGKRFYRLVGP